MPPTPVPSAAVVPRPAAATERPAPPRGAPAVRREDYRDEQLRDEHFRNEQLRDGPPPRRGPAERAATDEVLWSAASLPSPAPAVSVPQQRSPRPEPAADRRIAPTAPETPSPEPPRGARFPRASDGDTPAPGKRVRVVLAERKGVARPVRTVVDVQEGTPVGELLRLNLIRSQLSVALRFAVGAGLTLGVLPLLFALFPEIGRAEVLGLRVPWLLLGVLVYPFLLGLGWWHTRTAERVEQNFADHVQD